MEDFGKVRVYTCSCGCTPVRPLHGEPKHCDHCLSSLADRPYVVDDHMRFVKEMIGFKPNH